MEGVQSVAAVFRQGQVAAALGTGLVLEGPKSKGRCHGGSSREQIRDLRGVAALEAEAEAGSRDGKEASGAGTLGRRLGKRCKHPMGGQTR